MSSEHSRAKEAMPPHTMQYRFLEEGEGENVVFKYGSANPDAVCMTFSSKNEKGQTEFINWQIGRSLLIDLFKLESADEMSGYGDVRFSRSSVNPEKDVYVHFYYGEEGESRAILPRADLERFLNATLQWFNPEDEGPRQLLYDVAIDGLIKRVNENKGPWAKDPV